MFWQQSSGKAIPLFICLLIRFVMFYPFLWIQRFMFVSNKYIYAFNREQLYHFKDVFCSKT